MNATDLFKFQTSGMLTKHKVGVFFLVVLMACILNVSMSFASSDGVTKVICNVIKLVQGGIGKSIAIVILISLAIALFLGKVSWGLALSTAVGFGLLFGAPTIINAITGDPAAVCD